jgi:hypothetical protein
LYYHKRDNANSTNWVCSNKGCYASTTIENEDKIIKVNNVKLKDQDKSKVVKESHEHDPLTDNEIAVEVTLRKIKARVESEPTEVQQIYQQEQSKAAKVVKDFRGFAINFPEFYTVQSGLYKRRRSRYPPIPREIGLIVIDGE